MMKEDLTYRLTALHRAEMEREAQMNRLAHNAQPQPARDGLVRRLVGIIGLIIS